jgi:hypothetical protein
MCPLSHVQAWQAEGIPAAPVTTTTVQIVPVKTTGVSTKLVLLIVGLALAAVAVGVGLGVGLGLGLGGLHHTTIINNNAPASSNSATALSAANLIDALLQEAQQPNDLSMWVILGVNPSKGGSSGTASPPPASSTNSTASMTVADAQQQAQAITAALSDVSKQSMKDVGWSACHVTLCM